MRDHRDDINHGFSSHSGFSRWTPDFSQYDRSRPVNTERESHYGKSPPLQPQRQSLEPGEIPLSSGSNRFCESDRFGHTGLSQRGEYSDDERNGYRDRVKSSSDSRKFEYDHLLSHKNSKDNCKYYDDYDRNRTINSKDDFKCYADYDSNRTTNTCTNRNDFDGGDFVVPTSSSSRHRVLVMGPTSRNYGGGDGGSAPRSGCGSMIGDVGPTARNYGAVDDGGSIAATSCYSHRMMEIGPTSRSYGVTDGSSRGGLAARSCFSPQMIEMGRTGRNYGGGGSAVRIPRSPRAIEAGLRSRNYRVIDGSCGSDRDGELVSRTMEPIAKNYGGGGSAARSPCSPRAIETGLTGRNHRFIDGSRGSVWDFELVSRTIEPTGRNYGGGGSAARSPHSPRAIETGFTSRNYRDGSRGSIRDGESVSRTMEMGAARRNYGFGHLGSAHAGEPASYKHRMMEMGPTDIGRIYGVSDDFGVCRRHGHGSSGSPIKEFGLGGRERNNAMDSIVNKIEGRSRDFSNVISDEKILSENHDTSFSNERERDLEYLSMNLVRKRTRSVEKSNNVEDANTFVNNSIVNDRRLLLEKQDISFAANKYDLDHRSLNLVKKRRTVLEDDFYDDDMAYRNGTMSRRKMLSENDTSSFDMVKMRSSNILDSINREGNCDTDNDIAFGNNMMYKKWLDSSFVENDEDWDYKSVDFMKIKKSSSSIIDRIGSNVDDDIGSDTISERRRMVANDTSFGELDYDLDSRCSNSNPDILQYGELYGVSGDLYGDGLERRPFYHEDLYSTRSTSQRLVSPDETLEMRLTRMHSSDMETGIGDQRTVLSSGSSDLDEISHLNYGDAYNAYEDIQQLSMLQNSRHGQYRYGNPEMFNEMELRGNAISENSLEAYLLLPEQRNLSQQVRPIKLNVKQRLGPVPSVKDRLGPIPNAGRVAPKVKRKLPWVDIRGGKIMQDVKQNKPEPGEVLSLNSSEVKTKKHIKSEPPESSEEFSQLVQNACLKYVRILNENSATQRIYLEQGAGSLKCYICSSSKEFRDTVSLAQHSFTSCKVGSRSEHLGFGKALCVLMGWNSIIVPNGRWIQQILPAAEASSLREDLIIWPPVVLIHYSSIGNGNRDERMIVSTEQLKEILKGLGFEHWITKVCRGKAANHSIMVVNFKGVLSGLCEAEKLHKFFGEKNHGRTEFERISREGHKKNSEETEIPLDKVESVLYGYMGIAGDLDKLDFEIKKRCVVKSKKDILAIADANLK